MSETTKTVLIVGGVAVGAFVLLKAIAPSPGIAAYGKQPANTATASIQGLIGIGSALKGLFSSGGSSSSSPSSGPTAADLTAIGFDTNNYTTSNGFEYTDSSGKFIAG